MKRLLLAAMLLVAVLLPLVALAAVRDDYATQWPLILSRDDAGAYRVVLDEHVYRQLQTPDLRDFEVINADGVAMPAAVFAPEQPLAKPARRVPLPWFALPAAAADGAAAGWRLISEADADGRLRRVEVRTDDATALPLPRTALLLDLSRVREPIVALELQWKPVDALDLGYRVEVSDDLQHWRTLQTQGRLVDLRRDERRLLQRRIELTGLRHRPARYLRLTPDRNGQPIEVTALNAELADATVQAAPQWLALQPLRTSSAGTFEYDSGGRFPVQQVDIAMPGNHAAEWRLESRDAMDADWRPRLGPWVTYNIDDAGRGRRSGARTLGGSVRDRYWRLRASSDVAAGEPVLRLGYRPDVVVLLAQGPTPYRLVAGSARARRAESPLPQLVTALREQNGPAWRPAPAYLGTPQVLAGEAALQPSRDWKTWLLWGVLGLGALVVAGLAASLLRAPRTTQD
ncbi:DUF3999 domain-containing protein [Lysobacter sp. D1-1-M9]|uniref:DUF3999 domain-containing protein n=1 Tax=Novilysobacter longmucuonensis TaxID=3098603 RepID=UPI003203C4AD